MNKSWFRFGMYSLITSLTFFLLPENIVRSQAVALTQYASVRPAPEKRKFVSTAVEKEIVRVTGLIADLEVRWIFESCYPNTLDTTVNFTEPNGKPDTFIITGDINAMWLRDSSAQVQAYLPLCKDDPHLAEMVAGLIHRQAAGIQIDPYANAFHILRVSWSK